MRSEIINIIDKLSNIKWDILYYIKLVFDKQFRKTIYYNKRLKDFHKGERCFIVGNGPSLKKMDLSKLKSEITFTVNNIMQDMSIYEKINTDYHVIVDPQYYCFDQETPEGTKSIRLLKSINYRNKKPICLTGYEGRNAFHKYGLESELNLRYMYQHKNITDSFSGTIDLSRNMISSQNVIQAAIFAAIYMGFKEIYLIGCDMTSIFLTYEANEDGEKQISKDFHAYKYSENEMNIMIRDSSTNEYMLNDYAKTFTIFRRIQNYSLKQNIKIVNATIGGGLDIFSRIKYENIFAESI